MELSERERVEQRQAELEVIRNKARRRGTRLTKKKLIEMGMSEEEACSFLEDQKKIYEKARKRTAPTGFKKAGRRI